MSISLQRICRIILILAALLFVFCHYFLRSVVTTPSSTSVFCCAFSVSERNNKICYHLGMDDLHHCFTADSALFKELLFSLLSFFAFSFAAYGN